MTKGTSRTRDAGQNPAQTHMQEQLDSAAQRRALELTDGDETIFCKGHAHLTNSNEKFTPAEVIIALDNAAGIRSIAARRLGCSRATILNYGRRYPAIRAALAVIQAEVCDLAMHNLLQLIRKGDLRAVIWYLEKFGQDRGYGRQGAISPRNNPQTTVDLGALPPDLLREVHKAIAARAGQQ